MNSTIQDEVQILQSRLKTIEFQLAEKSKQLLLKDLFNKINSGEYQLSDIEIMDELFFDTEKVKKYTLTIKGNREQI